MRFSRRGISKCKECPLNGEVKIFGKGPDEPCSYALIGDYPLFKDVAGNEPFVNEYSGYLYYALGQANIRKSRVWKTNALVCKVPPGMWRDDIDQAVKCCRKGFLAELEFLKKEKGVKIFIPLGDSAMKMLRINVALLQMRGSVVLRDLWRSKTNWKIRDEEEQQPDKSKFKKIIKDLVIVPTFNPKFIFKGNRHQEPTWVSDFIKCKEIVIKGYKKIKENFNLFPTVKEILEFRDKVVKDKQLVSCDIETTGLSASKGEVYCIGMATSESDCIVVARLLKGGYQQFVNGESKLVKKALKDILAKCPTAWQNALFDVPFLLEKGYPVKNVTEDTFLAHHVRNAELPHTLGYITSVYGKTPYWKNIFKARECKITDMEEEDARKYNARDCVVIPQILKPLLKELKEDDTYHIYRNISIPLIKPVVAMIMNGIKIDQKKLSKWQKELIVEVAFLSRGMSEFTELPEVFKITSIEHLRFLFFGVPPKSSEKVKKEYAEYFVEGCKKRKDTKKFAELTRKHTLITELKPLRVVGSSFAKTDGGDISTDEAAFTEYFIRVKDRMDTIDNLKRPQYKHTCEHHELVRVKDALIIIMKFRKTNKLLTTYTKFDLDANSRVHPKYKIHGTSTGRLSSNDPNGQNIPSVAKHIFVVNEGNIFFNADFSGLELAIIAYASNDNVIIDMIKNDLNPHDENTKRIFKITKDAPDWQSKRSCMKTYIFGRNYGGGLRGMYKRLLTKDPTITVTYEEFKIMDTKYFNEHPAYRKWYEQTKQTLTKEKSLVNGFGRKRYFLGDENNILREGLNFPIQSTAGDLMSLALIDVQKELEKKGYVAKLIGSVHDSMMLEIPKTELKQVATIVKKVMTKPRKIFGVERSFKVDFEIGPSWGELEEYKI